MQREVNGGVRRSHSSLSGGAPQRLPAWRRVLPAHALAAVGPHAWRRGPVPAPRPPPSQCREAAARTPSVLRQLSRPSTGPQGCTDTKLLVIVPFPSILLQSKQICKIRNQSLCNVGRSRSAQRQLPFSGCLLNTPTFHRLAFGLRRQLASLLLQLRLRLQLRPLLQRPQ